MIARAHIVTEGTRITRLRSEPPIALRPAADGVYLVGAAAGPLGGDELTVDIEVAAGASLTIRSAAASIVLPGAGPSRMSIHASVGPGASLRWAPEPTVLARGCGHRIEAVVVLARGARLEWWEELVLGRFGEPSGSATTRLRVDLDGEPLLRQDLAVGPDNPASMTPPLLPTDARALGSVALVGPGVARRPLVLSETAAVLPLDGPAALVTAVGSDALTVRRWLQSGVERAAVAEAAHRG